MFTHPLYRLFLLLPFLPAPCLSQNNVPLESELLSFESTGAAENNRAILHVQIFEAGANEPILGATVLLRRDVDKMHGKVSNEYGSCTFIVAPGDYAIRVQMSGLKSLEKPGLLLEGGKIYEMKLVMAATAK